MLTCKKPPERSQEVFFVCLKYHYIRLNISARPIKSEKTDAPISSILFCLLVCFKPRGIKTVPKIKNMIPKIKFISMDLSPRLKKGIRKPGAPTPGEKTDLSAALVRLTNYINKELSNNPEGNYSKVYFSSSLTRSFIRGSWTFVSSKKDSSVI